MDSFYRPTRVEISLDALKHNLLGFRKILPADMKIMAVVKANAYGHGARQIAEEAVASGAEYLGVAFLDEALELRNAGITAPILVLGYTSPGGLRVAAEHDITLTVYSTDVLDALESIQREQGQSGLPKLKVHVKIDTGMGRIGLFDEDTAIAFIERLRVLPHVTVEALFTHYACADEEDKSYTLEQHRRFSRLVEHFRARNIEFPLLHAGNSATGIQFPELSYNMVRLGISLYGLYPSEEVNQQRVELEPVMSFKTAVVMVKTLPPNSGVSYGAIYTTKDYEQVATLPVGYADGYTRMLTGRANVLLRGKQVPVIGRICMDQCMILADGMSDLQLGEEIVLFGRQGEACIPAEALAEWLGTINYEITCMISNRVPRVYIREGQVAEAINPLLHS